MTRDTINETEFFAIVADMADWAQGFHFQKVRGIEADTFAYIEADTFAYTDINYCVLGNVCATMRQYDASTMFPVGAIVYYGKG